MTPKKIYISESTAQKQLPSNGVSIGLQPLYSDDICYILESEHNRIVDELKAENEGLKAIEELLKMTLEVSEFKTAEINRLKQSNWVSVEKKMPLKQGSYICYYKFIDNNKIDTEVSLVLFDGKKFSKFLSDNIIVTHWMPLPQPPKEK